MPQELMGPIPGGSSLMDEVNDNMLDHMLQEASQPSQLTQEHGPLPDCAFIQDNQPTARPVVLTTSTKEGRSHMTKAKKNAAGTSKKKKAKEGSKDVAAAKKKKA
ncbi:Os09g0260550 [Oryza sativa Japonica Group]|uniref:Os09g0260550 protein n=3 Tax=Oryza sativa subsp. japonica TaxID=39947 RepID=B9G2F1_ORYSJ|nr:hypothetical protein OsJ_28576 [Oryza sativa Japonica Group]BAT07107.1 Os09g0260550 [Oryza sativa Japonica Group]